ncbi:unnamed protein product [Prunus armeniaca]
MVGLPNGTFVWFLEVNAGCFRSSGRKSPLLPVALTGNRLVTVRSSRKSLFLPLVLVGNRLGQSSHFSQDAK